MTTQIIKLENGLPTGNPLAIPRIYGSIGNPRLVDMLAGGEYAEYVAPAFDPATETTGDYMAVGDSWTHAVVPLSAPALAALLASAKLFQKDEILAAFTLAETTPETINGVDYWADIASALRLDGARRLVVEAISVGLLPPETPVVLTDTSRVFHSMDPAAALMVCLAIGQRAQTDFQNKQAKIQAIDAATTMAQVMAIQW